MKELDYIIKNYKELKDKLSPAEITRVNNSMSAITAGFKLSQVAKDDVMKIYDKIKPQK